LIALNAFYKKAFINKSRCRKRTSGLTECKLAGANISKGEKGPFEFINRRYWLDARFTKDGAGKMTLEYGSFKGIKLDE